MLRKTPTNEVRGKFPRERKRLAAAAAAFFLLAALAQPAAAGHNDRGGARKLIDEQHATLAIRDGGRVRIEMDMGDVHIMTGARGTVVAHLRVESSSGAPVSAGGRSPFGMNAVTTSDGVAITGRTLYERHSGRLWVSLEVTMPKNSPLEVNTQGGTVDVANLDASVGVETAGGNVTVGRVGGEARLESGGGHITVQDVTGALNASTGGGHITAGRVHGDAVLRSGGGHIRVAAVDGAAHLETGGGNIFLQQAGARLVVTTGGGRIVVGNAPAGVQARTGGGGIRILRVLGPTEVETGSGSIFLSSVQGSVRATTASGGITAWLAPPAVVVPAPGKGPSAPKVVQRPGDQATEFESGNGDIVVYVPRTLPVNIEATVENADEYKIDADPAIQFKVTSGTIGEGGALRAETSLNGGGPRVRLKAEDGNIRLRLVEGPEPPMPFDEAKFEARLEKSFSSLEDMLEEQNDSIDRYCDLQQRKYEMEFDMKEHFREMKRHAQEMAEQGREMRRQMEESHRRTEEVWADRVVVSADDLKQKLVHRIEPVYPERAKRQSLEGTVRLRVAVDAEGRVEDVKILSGSPLFTRAAADAVRQWRYEPILVEGKAVPVAGEVTVTFRLQ
jgi:TonB family protein